MERARDRSGLKERMIMIVVKRRLRLIKATNTAAVCNASQTARNFKIIQGSLTYDKTQAEGAKLRQEGSDNNKSTLQGPPSD